MELKYATSNNKVLAPTEYNTRGVQNTSRKLDSEDWVGVNLHARQLPNAQQPAKRDTLGWRTGACEAYHRLASMDFNYVTNNKTVLAPTEYNMRDANTSRN